MAFYWGNPLNWVLARRDITARFWDRTDASRAGWVAAQRARFANPDFSLDFSHLSSEFSFMVLGDPGEGDLSQMVVVDRFLRESRDTAFTVIASDVVYPSGRSADYREKFYVPFRGYRGDIYAVPGNHDWYDGLVGFMIHFCENAFHRTDTSRPTIEADKLAELRRIRCNQRFQPNMYFYVDTPQVRIVCVDTGIRGRIDAAQEEWLQRVSAAKKPKVLISGKPIYVDGEFNAKLSNLNRIVNEGGYSLVIAGDTHNFQEYRLRVTTNGKERFVWHLVNGGAGRFSAERIGPARARHEASGADSERTGGLRVLSDEAAVEPILQLVEGASAAVDRDRPPYHKSFVKIIVLKHGLRVGVFEVDDFSAQGPRRSPPARVGRTVRGRAVQLSHELE